MGARGEEKCGRRCARGRFRKFMGLIMDDDDCAAAVVVVVVVTVVVVVRFKTE